MADYRVTGAESLARAARALKAEGEAGKGLRKEMLKGIRDATKPLKADVKKSALDTLPHQGGLNRVVAGASFGTRTRTTGKNVGVRMTAKGKRLRDIKSTDAGRLRHPVFAKSTQTRKQWTWVTQNIKPGWWTRPLEEGAPTVRRDLVAAIERVLNEVARRSHR